MSARERRSLMLLAALAAVLFLFKVGMPLTDGDSAYYGKIARNIVSSGNWLTLHYRGNDFVDKPPLSIWPIAFSYRLFGVHDWATRGWHSLLAVGSVLLTYALGRRLFSAVEGFWGGLVLATSFLMAYSGQVPQQDVPLVFLALLSFSALVRYVQEGRTADWLLACAAVGLGVLNRGLQGAVFPAGVILLYLALLWLVHRPEQGEGWRLPSVPVFLAGVAVFLAVAVPWFYLEYRQLGVSFLHYYFGGGNARYLKDIAPPSPGGPLVYVPLLLVSVLPWAGFTFSSLKLGVQEALGGRRRREGRSALFLVAWFLVAFLLPFAIRWRVIRYLLPALPPLALLTGRFIRLLLGGRDGQGAERSGPAAEFRWISWASLAVGLLLVVGVASAVSRFPQARAGLVPVLVPFLALFLSGTAGFALAGLLRRPRLALGLLAGAVLLSYLVVFHQLDRHLFLLNPWRSAATAVNAGFRPGDRVFLVQEGNNPFVDYYVQAPVEVLQPDAFAGLLEKRRMRMQDGDAGRRWFALTDTATAATLQAQSGPSRLLRWQVYRYPGGKALAVVTFRQA